MGHFQKPFRHNTSTVGQPLDLHMSCPLCPGLRPALSLWWRLSKCSSIIVDPEENHCQPVGALQCWKSISVGNWSTLNILNLDTHFRHHQHIHHPNLYPNPQLPAAFKGKVVRVEAWILRRLVYVFTRVARRGHRPREFCIRSLMEVANIPVPERTTSSSRSLSWELIYRTDL